MKTNSFSRQACGACLTLLTVAVLGGTAKANTITLNLNSLPTGPFFSPLSVDGFTLTPITGGGYVWIINTNGENTLSTIGWGATGAGAILTRDDGGAFTLDSIAVAAVNGDTGNYAVGVQVWDAETYSGSGGYVYGIYEASQPNYGGPLTTNFVTQDYSADAQFHGVTAIALINVNNGDGDAIKSITVTSVPEPGSAALMGLGCVGLVGMRRRKQGKSQVAHA